MTDAMKPDVHHRWEACQRAFCPICLRADLEGEMSRERPELHRDQVVQQVDEWIAGELSIRPGRRADA